MHQISVANAIGNTEGVGISRSIFDRQYYTKLNQELPVYVSNIGEKTHSFALRSNLRLLDIPHEEIIIKIQ